MISSSLKNQIHKAKNKKYLQQEKLKDLVTINARLANRG